MEEDKFMTKIKVNKRLFNTLNKVKNIYEGDLNAIIAIHDYDWVDECEPLNELNHLELARLLILGYEEYHYTSENIPEGFTCKINKSIREYTIRKFKRQIICIWQEGNRDLDAITYDLDKFLDMLNSGNVVIIKTL